MNLVHLRSFLATADTLNFTKASESLFITQSSLSRHISLLEQSLGVKLLERDKHRVVLTKAGELLFTEGKQIISHINTVERHVKNADSDGRPKLDIVCSPMFSQCLGNIYREYSAHYPLSSCSIVQTEWGNEIKAIIQNEADVAISFATSESMEEKGLITQVLKKERLCIICNKNSALTQKDELLLKDFAEETLLFADKPDCSYLQNIHYSISTYFKELRHLNNLHAVILEICNNNGIAILPESVVTGTQNFSSILHVRDFHRYCDLTATWLFDNHNPEISNFLSLRNFLLSEQRQKIQ